jgi:xanthine dehydrogenase accessory factor
VRDLICRLLEALHQQTPLVYCQLVETRGSTPQKPGAAMLVFPDGSQAGTLGGGCVEAEVKRRSLKVLSEGRAQIAKFQLDHDYGWDDGLICGGRMQVLIDPLAAGKAEDYFQALRKLADSRRGGQEAIVFDAAASGLAEASCYLFDEEDQVVASRNAAVEPTQIAEVSQHLRPLAKRPLPYAAHGIAYLPALPRCRLLIVGGGHVGKAVADMASDLDFDVWVVDDREEYVSESRFPKAQRRIAGTIGQILPKLEVTPDTYCLIVTRGHSHDQEALFHLAPREARYVGMIGSRRKIKLIYDELLTAGVSAEDLAAVYAPLGIDIGSQTVAEIAVSICAELVSHRNREGVVPGRPERIHVEI